VGADRDRASIGALVVTLRVSPDVRWRTVDGEAVIVSQTAGEVLGLNETGARFLALVADGRGFDDIVAQLADEFDAPRTEIERDVAALRDDLLGAGVLVDA
jgi:hypothetical protein